MEKKSFVFGCITGVVFTFVLLFVVGYFSKKHEASSEDDAVDFLEKPCSYENKKEASFKVFQVLGVDAALAHESSYEFTDSYYGKTVMLLGSDFYNDQVITVENPMRVGTYNYVNKSSIPMTVPVIDLDCE